MKKFFRNGNTFSAYCRMRYGQSKLIWADTTLWAKAGLFAIEFDEAAADAKFAPRPAKKTAPRDEEEDYDDGEKSLRQMENMAAYIHSGAGLSSYYADQEAGYVE